MRGVTSIDPQREARRSTGGQRTTASASCTARTRINGLASRSNSSSASARLTIGSCRTATTRSRASWMLSGSPSPTARSSRSQSPRDQKSFWSHGLGCGPKFGLGAAQCRSVPDFWSSMSPFSRDFRSVHASTIDATQPNSTGAAFESGQATESEHVYRRSAPGRFAKEAAGASL